MSTGQAKSKQSSRWGSLLSGAVAGIESRLDTILADDNEASAKSRAADAALLESEALNAKEGGAIQVNATDVLLGSPVKWKPSDRLQERLAKASGSRPGSQTVSEAGSPRMTASPSALEEAPRTSLSSRPSAEMRRSFDVSGPAGQTTTDLGISLGIETQKIPMMTVNEAHGSPGTLLQSVLPINPARHSEDAMVCPQASTGLETSTNGTTRIPDVDGQSSAQLQAELVRLHSAREEEDKKRQEEMDTVLERVDALQAKLSYLAKESLMAAREANGSAEVGSTRQTLAAKDEEIALLMEEGLSLSKTELRHLATIRKLTAKAAAEQRTTAQLRQDLSRIRSGEAVARAQISKLERVEREHNTRLARLSQAEAELATNASELESRESTIVALRRRLQDANKRIEDLETESERSAQLTNSRRIDDLEEQVSSLRIEKQLAEEMGRAAQERLRKELESRDISAQASRLELETEVNNLEARLEATRLRAEEATSDQTGESQAKLLRQIETSQTQYTLAAENWRSIEASLNVRLSAVEKERDDTVRHEGELRKKARDVALKCRKLEQELDSGTDRTSDLNGQLLDRDAAIKKLEIKLEVSEKALQDAQISFEQQRQNMEAIISARVEEERSRRASISISGTQESKHNSSPTSTQRRPHGMENTFGIPTRRALSRGQTNDSITSLSAYDLRSRRSSALLYNDRLVASPPLSNSHKLSHLSLSDFSAGHGALDFELPSTPSIVTDAPTEDTDAGGAGSTRGSSRHATAADVLSASTVHTGPSVQLVERMSSSIRRLEAEKAAHRDELARVTAQRDEVRDQLVDLMRDAEAARDQAHKIESLDKGLAELRVRYDACLEMLGEREEERDELREELGDMRRIYKELVARMGHA